ncbi:PREDICTED: eukaryotic translation initiation factor 2-alpha kinase 4 isoform X2 [Polistes dominula]|nr:PREDICTED: eukaryotic translation initiation factor 2-alpha kinase 4 isoform X2 [Polistes dominula]
MSGPAEIYAQIDLHITCGEKYPDVVPTMELKNSQGLSNQQVEILYSELKRLACQLSGEVMIFELAQHVQKYLHEHNKPSYSSFYEEMIIRHEEKKQYEMQEKQLKENKERQVLQDEIQKRQDALKAEMRNFARKYFEPDTAASQTLPSSPQERIRTYSRRRCTSTSECSEGSLCEHRGTKLLHFDSSKGERQIHRGKCLGHNNKGSTTYAGLDMTSGELVVVTEWTLKYGTHKEKQEKRDITDLSYGMKQISSLEQELNHLHKLHHPNLVHYLNMKYVQDNNNIIIYILQEFVVGTSCAFFLMENISIDIDILRHLATGILSALQYLHENNVVHRDLRDTSVFIDHIGGVRLADYSLDKRLADIYRTSSLPKVEHDLPTIQGRGGKKADIYRFGILMLSLLKGTIVSGKDIDLTIILQPHLKDFISKCLASDERMRWSVEQLLQHSFIKTPLDHGLSRLQLKNKVEQKNDEPEKPDSDIELHLPTLGGQSRIRNEFEILKWLGKGAYGDVLKVKNKLDRGVYAIKRIELNPKKRQLNRKITREVKLLSRVNHENVVRYYNSWIESGTIDESLRHDDSILSLNTSSINISDDQVTKLDTVNHLESEEKSAPSTKDIESSISYGSVASAANTADSENNNSDESSESDSDDDSSFVVRTFRRIDSSSDSIEFREDISQASPDNSNDHEKSNVNTLNTSGGKEIQFMYIQMEFCEKSTLRTAIDNGLYEDQERVWRLFREIVEGLAHIHQQGMIHRDLKPVNIFLDSNDHVKIGDFGLATSNILSSLAQTADNDKETDRLDKDSFYDGDEVRSLTGDVGTALYAAPELSGRTSKPTYNQKVDIYSLGIILFEMCYKPLTTGMERVNVLLNLRSKDIILPSDLSESNMPHQVHLFRWLLNHDPIQRPTAQELLSSEYLPPPQLEETELQEMVRHTLSNTQSKAYKYLVASCFMQEVTAAEDITYDMNFTAREITNLISSKRLYVQENVKAKVIEIFQKHGGISLNTPLLMPKSSQHNNFTDASVQLMTQTGSIVSIPHDLRAPFARYVVWNKIPHLRRYAIERVFREKKVRGFHPRELYECAFDIISPMENNLMAEGELIFIAWEIFNEIPHLRERNFTIRLNHTLLLQAVLMYCGIENEKYQDVYSILCDARDGKFTKFQVQTHFITLCLTDQAIETIFNLFETESSFSKISSILKTIAKRKGDAAPLAKEALHDIEEVIANIEALGVKWPIIIAPLLVHHKIKQYSGVIYQITCELKHRRKGGQDVIAAGGRYDKMLMSFRQILERTEMTNKETKQYGVGISISLDKLVCAVEEMSESIYRENKFGIDVAIYCDGFPRREKEMINVLRELWSIGIRTTILDINTVEEVLEYCQEHSITQIILLKNNERNYLRLQTWERDRFQERKIGIQEIADFLQRQTDNPLPILNRSESKSNATDVNTSSNNPTNANINFIISERDKLTGNGKRIYKNTILAQMSFYLQRISHKVPIEIFAVFLDMTVIRTITSFLEIDEEEQDFQKSILIVIDKHPRHKKYIQLICEEMREIRKEKVRPVVILYSLQENRYMTLI